MNFHKPHYRWKEIFVTNDLVTGEIPAWAIKASTGASIGNIDASDLKPPRLKVLAGMSPEVMNGTPGAIPGNFWMTVLGTNLGNSVKGTFIVLKKSYVLWAPKSAGSETKGPLAVASDGTNWDVPNQTFEIKFFGNPKTYKWKILKTVQENGMHLFGSERDDDPNSKPAATLTYDMLWSIDMPSGRKQMCVFQSSKSGATKTQTFLTALGERGIDACFQRYEIVVEKKTGPTGDPYFTYNYHFLEAIKDEVEGMAMQALYKQYRKSGFVAEVADETEEIKAARRGPPGPEMDDDIPF